MATVLILRVYCLSITCNVLFQSCLSIPVTSPKTIKSGKDENPDYEAETTIMTEALNTKSEKASSTKEIEKNSTRINEGIKTEKNDFQVSSTEKLMTTSKDKSVIKKMKTEKPDKTIDYLENKMSNNQSTVEEKFVSDIKQKIPVKNTLVTVTNDLQLNTKLQTELPDENQQNEEGEDNFGQDSYDDKGDSDQDEKENSLATDNTSHRKKNKSTYDDNSGAESSHFFAYFVTVVILCIVGYVVFQNKHKIIAIVIEGRDKQINRRPNSGNYKPLETNVEEMIGKIDTSTVTKKYIY